MASISWKESKKIIETFNHKQNFIYVDYVSKYIASGCDGHDAHISAVEKMIKKGELKMRQYFEKQLNNPLYISPMWKTTLIDNGPSEIDVALTAEDILKQASKQLQCNSKGKRLVYYILEYDNIEDDRTYSENRREVDRLDDMLETYERFGLSIVFKSYANDGDTPIFELKNEEEKCT